MKPIEAYEELLRRSKDLTVLDSCASVLGWDQETYMPPGGVSNRSKQLALLAGLGHEKATDPRIGELLTQIEGSDLVSDPLLPAAVNVRQLRRSYDRKTKLPQKLVEEIARTTSLAQREWAEARKRKNFEEFRPWLEKIVGLKRQEADALGHDGVIYDPLLDGYEQGATTEQVAKVFANLRLELVPLVAAIADASHKPDLGIVRRDFSVERQKIFGESAAAAIGFDFQNGRLDTTTHPCCSTFGPGDCRITTRYNPGYFNDAFFSILHEAGHGLYEQGLDTEHYGTSMGQAVSLGVHESQSRMWENAVGRCRGFWEYFFPRARQIFPSSLHDVRREDFHFAVNSVQPSLIRVDADEVTYNLHVLVRFEMEQALLSGDLPVSEVPGTWNEKYEKYLGITPEDDAQGCLQDVHWSCGLFGYFPTYTLGNLYAAQLFECARRDLGDLDQSFAKGEFSGLLGWLREKVYRQGQRYTAADLIEHVTGSPPSHVPLMRFLREKFGELYAISCA